MFEVFLTRATHRWKSLLGIEVSDPFWLVANYKFVANRAIGATLEVAVEARPMESCFTILIASTGGSFIVATNLLSTQMTDPMG